MHWLAQDTSAILTGTQEQASHLLQLTLPNAPPYGGVPCQAAFSTSRAPTGSTCICLGPTLLRQVLLMKSTLCPGRQAAAWPASVAADPAAPGGPYKGLPSALTGSQQEGLHLAAPGAPPSGLPSALTDSQQEGLHLAARGAPHKVLTCALTGSQQEGLHLLQLRPQKLQLQPTGATPYVLKGIRRQGLQLLQRILPRWPVRTPTCAHTYKERGVPYTSEAPSSKACSCWASSCCHRSLSEGLPCLQTDRKRQGLANFFLCAPTAHPARCCSCSPKVSPCIRLV